MLVLVIACTNVAMLLVAKKSARQREFSLRLALGATRRKIFWQLLLESALLVSLGGTLGWIFALSATRALAVWSQIEAGLSPDRTVLFFTFAVCAVACVVFSLAPLFPALSVSVASSLKTSASTSHRSRASKWGGNLGDGHPDDILFRLACRGGTASAHAAELSIHQFGPALTGSSGLWNYTAADLQQQPECSVLPLIVGSPAQPSGIESVSFAENRPGSGWSDNDSATIDGVEHTYSEAPLRANKVGPNFFRVMGIPVLDGRDVSDTDTETSPPVVVVNETFARRLMPGINPLGHQLGGKPRRTIVGVVKDSKYTRVNEDPIPMAYYPCMQVEGVNHLEVEVRLAGTLAGGLPSIERTVRAMDPNLPLENPMMQQAVFEQSYSQQRMFSRLSLFFGSLAAFLVAIWFVRHARLPPWPPHRGNRRAHGGWCAAPAGAPDVVARKPPGHACGTGARPSDCPHVRGTHEVAVVWPAAP